MIDGLFSAFNEKAGRVEAAGEREVLSRGSRISASCLSDREEARVLRAISCLFIFAKGRFDQRDAFGKFAAFP